MNKYMHIYIYIHWFFFIYIYIYIHIAWSDAWSSSSGTSECHHPRGATSHPVRLDHYYGAWFLSCMVELLRLPPCDHPQGPKSGNCIHTHPCNKTRKQPSWHPVAWNSGGRRRGLRRACPHLAPAIPRGDTHYEHTTNMSTQKHKHLRSILFSHACSSAHITAEP